MFQFDAAISLVGADGAEDHCAGRFYGRGTHLTPSAPCTSICRVTCVTETSTRSGRISQQSLCVSAQHTLKDKYLLQLEGALIDIICVDFIRLRWGTHIVLYNLFYPHH